MSEIDDIVNEIYDSKIERPEYQTLMASCIKAWIRDAINRGIRLGKEELALEIDVIIKKRINPNAVVAVIKS